MVWQQCGSLTSAPGMIYPQWRERPAPSPLPLPPSLSWGPTARRTYLWTPRGGIRKQGLCPQMSLSRWMALSRRTHARAHAGVKHRYAHHCWIVPHHSSHHACLHTGVQVCQLGDDGAGLITTNSKAQRFCWHHFYPNILIEASTNMD